MKIARIDQSHLGAKSVFYVDGEIVGEPGKRHMRNQMYVEALFPKQQLHPFPVVFFHGAGQTNVNWMITPDGRMGWADYFVSKGYAVYLCEQPSRGRSAYHPEDNGPRMYHSLESLQRFMSDAGAWPQSARHTQWPGEGTLSFTDEADRQFIASQVEYLTQNRDSQQLVKDCALRLLRGIGLTVLPLYYVRNNLAAKPCLHQYAIDPAYHAYWSACVYYRCGEYPDRLTQGVLPILRDAARQLSAEGKKTTETYE